VEIKAKETSRENLFLASLEQTLFTDQVGKKKILQYRIPRIMAGRVTGTS